LPIPGAGGTAREPGKNDSINGSKTRLADVGESTGSQFYYGYPGSRLKTVMPLTFTT